MCSNKNASHIRFILKTKPILSYNPNDADEMSTRVYSHNIQPTIIYKKIRCSLYNVKNQHKYSNIPGEILPMSHYTVKATLFFLFF